MDRIVKNEGFLSVIDEPGDDLSFVVEADNKNNQNILEIFNDYRNKDPRRFAGIVFENKKTHIALQAADFLAYYSRRIRNKNFASANADADMRFFEMATEAISHSQFLATDFGTEPVRSSSGSWPIRFRD